MSELLDSDRDSIFKAMTAMTCAVWACAIAHTPSQRSRSSRRLRVLARSKPATKRSWSFGTKRRIRQRTSWRWRTTAPMSKGILLRKDWQRLLCRQDCYVLVVYVCAAMTMKVSSLWQLTWILLCFKFVIGFFWFYFCIFNIALVIF